jgi:hypothetical protein
MKLLGVLSLVLAALYWIGPARSADDKGAVVKLGTLTSRAPAEWKQQKPGNRLRVYQFLLPRAEKDGADAQLVIFYFPGGGGTADANVKRWKGMFRPPEGKSLDDVSKVDKFKVSGASVTYLDVQGTYLDKFPPFDPNAKTIRRPDYRMLGIVFQTEGDQFFIRLTGPARTVGQHKKEFDHWLKAFK